jgi:putative ABC transport system permease protein
LRNIIVGFQFGIAIMLASGAAVIYAQNRHMDSQSTLFDRDNIVLLDRIGREGVAEKYETMKAELKRIPGVEAVTASNNVPYEQSSDSSRYARVQGDTASAVGILMIYTDHDFMETYEVPILAGRDFSRDIALDTFYEEVEGEERQSSVNIILNRMAAKQLGWEKAEDSLNGSFFYSDSESPSIEHRVVGIIEDFNYQGALSRVRPMIFVVHPAGLETAAIHISGGNVSETVRQIDEVWNRLHPDFPLVRSFLDDQFEQLFSLLRMLATILGGFALVAVFVAFIGLFGLSAFVARSRTKEIGLRKILGATVGRLMQLMVYQISIPVLIAMVPAALLAWAGMNFGYLQAFSERIGSVVPFIVVAAAAVLILAWIVVSINAWKVASASPIHALRYE